MSERIEVLNGQGWIELIDHMGDELKIVNAARIAYGRKSEELSESDLGVLTGLLTNGHTSPLEHVVFTFHVYAPILVIRQWFRHRTWSYSELSRRYSKKDIVFYVPTHFTGDGVKVEDEDVCRAVIEKSNLYSIELYNRLLKLGVKPEQARSVLPVSLMSEFYATVNLNNFIKFVNLRSDSHAQWEIQQYSNAMKTLVKEIVPHVAETLKW